MQLSYDKTTALFQLKSYKTFIYNSKLSFDDEILEKLK